MSSDYETPQWVEDFDRHRRITALLRPRHVWPLPLTDGTTLEFRWGGSTGVNVYTLTGAFDPGGTITRREEDYFTLMTEGFRPSVEEVERAIADYLVERPFLDLAGLEDA